MRRRNVVPPDAFPYDGPTGVRYDSGDYARALDEATRLIGYAAFRAEQAAARERGHYLGIGFALYCEFAGPGWDSAQVRAQPDGTVTVSVGISPHGQGTETMLAQVVADTLGIAPGQVVVRSGDTAITPQGIGTFGSRNTSIGGSAVLLAARQVAAKARRLAGTMLEAAEEDIALIDGRYAPQGVPERGLTFAQIARAAHRMTGAPGGLAPGLEATEHFMPDGRTFPFGVHVAIVAIDRDDWRIDRAPLPRRGRLRRADQPAPGRGSGARRAGAGVRPGTAGVHRLRRRGPTPQRHLPRLRRPARRAVAELRLGHTVTPSPLTRSAPRGSARPARPARPPPSSTPPSTPSPPSA